MLNRSLKISNVKEIKEETLDILVLQLNPKGDIFGSSHSYSDPEDNLVKRLGLSMITTENIRNNGTYNFNLQTYLRHTDESNMSHEVQHVLADYIDEIIAGKRNSFELDNRCEGKSGYFGETDETALHIHIHGSKDIISGNYTIVITDQTDVTKSRDELIKTNKRLEKLAEFGEYATKGVHEIRGMLVSIGGFARRIFDKTKDPKLLEYSKIIIDDEIIAERIATESLNYTRELRYNYEFMNINDLVNDLTKRLTQIDNNNPDLETEIIQNLNSVPDIYADKSKIGQCLLNLGKNAVEKGAPSIEISTYVLDNYVVCEITDNGELIPQNVLKQITKPFFTTKDKGTGVGISIVEEIITAHKGKLIIDSGLYENINRTSFAIYIPINSQIKE